MQNDSHDDRRDDLDILDRRGKKVTAIVVSFLCKPMEVGRVRASPCNLLHFAQAIFLRADNKEMYMQLADAFHSAN